MRKKNILVISTSLRHGSNSEALADEFARGAAEAGNDVQKVTLRGKDIGFCRGCLSCQKTLRCALNDDATSIAEQMKNADAIAFATPVYYYEMSGQMKTLLDRANPLFSSDYMFRNIYLLAAAAEESPETMDGTVNGLEGWIACFEKARLAGVVRGTGVTDPGEMQRNSAVLEEAYRMGLNA